ncbi:hypothetical protein JCM10207_003867 [Rhodosporidiobolus poonsookiae]
MAPTLPIELKLYIIELAAPPLSTSSDPTPRNALLGRLALVDSTWHTAVKAEHFTRLPLNVTRRGKDVARRNRERLSALSLTATAVRGFDLTFFGDQLSLDQAIVQEATVHLLRSFPGLEELVLRKAWLAPAALLCYEQFPVLKRLTILGGSVKSSLPSTLSFLSLDDALVFQWPPASSLPNLDTLLIRRSKLGVAQHSFLHSIFRSAPRLRVLGLQDLDEADWGFDLLPSSLRHVCVSSVALVGSRDGEGEGEAELLRQARALPVEVRSVTIRLASVEGVDGQQELSEWAAGKEIDLRMEQAEEGDLDLEEWAESRREKRRPWTVVCPSL